MPREIKQENTDDLDIVLMMAELQDMQLRYKPTTSVGMWLRSAIGNLDGVKCAISAMKKEGD